MSRIAMAGIFLQNLQAKSLGVRELTSGMERERLDECVGLAERPLLDAHRGERVSCLPRLCNTRCSSPLWRLVPGTVEFLGCLSELHDEVTRDIVCLCSRQKRSRERNTRRSVECQGVIPGEMR